jgi:hypothetical protein
MAVVAREAASAIVLLEIPVAWLIALVLIVNLTPSGSNLFKERQLLIFKPSRAVIVPGRRMPRREGLGDDRWLVRGESAPNAKGRTQNKIRLSTGGIATNLPPCLAKAGIAQLVEQLICNQQVVGSNPTAGSVQYQRLT